MLKVLSIFFSIISLVSCGKNDPSYYELEAKSITLEAVKTLFQELELIADTSKISDEGRTSTYVIFSGNYTALTSRAKAHYRTNISGVTACEIYQKFLENQTNWKKDKHEQPCRIINHSRSKSFRAQARDVVLQSQKQFFYADILIEEHNAPKNVDGMDWKTEVKISINRGLYIPASTACAPPINPEKPWPCQNAKWLD